MLNTVALIGHLSRPAVLRTLPSGVSLVSLELTTRRGEGERADTMPVVWPGAPAWAHGLDTGEDLVVVGHVARRFFKAGTLTQSRTEVVASVIVPIRTAKRATQALRDAILPIQDAIAAVPQAGKRKTVRMAKAS